jgi:hypothetical protein
MKRFFLKRKEDASGVSGTGRVADGVQYDSGKCVLCWLSDRPCIGVYESIDDVVKIHGHGGKTEIQWIDESHD